MARPKKDDPDGRTIDGIIAVAGLKEVFAIIQPVN